MRDYELCFYLAPPLAPSSSLQWFIVLLIEAEVFLIGPRLPKHSPLTNRRISETFHQLLSWQNVLSLAVAWANDRARYGVPAGPETSCLFTQPLWAVASRKRRGGVGNGEEEGHVCPKFLLRSIERGVLVEKKGKTELLPHQWFMQMHLLAADGQQVDNRSLNESRLPLTPVWGDRKKK